MGTFSINNRTVAESAISTALASGFRHIDAAMIYNNEQQIGAGIAFGLEKNNLQRKDIWVTTKLWNSNHANPEIGLKNSLEKLNLTYVDLYLMHFPIGPPGPDRKPDFDHLEVSVMPRFERSANERRPGSGWKRC
jgi:alcohol dehydrogenase (NADP+)